MLPIKIDMTATIEALHGNRREGGLGSLDVHLSVILLLQIKGVRKGSVEAVRTVVNDIIRQKEAGGAVAVDAGGGTTDIEKASEVFKQELSKEQAAQEFVDNLAKTKASGGVDLTLLPPCPPYPYYSLPRVCPNLSFSSPWLPSAI